MNDDKKFVEYEKLYSETMYLVNTPASGEKRSRFYSTFTNVF